MIRAISVDDETHCLDRLSRLLTEHCAATVQLIGTAQSVEEGVTLILNRQPDLIFLDVQIQDQTGFDLLKQVHPFGGDVIFTTAFEKYAVQAFKFSAVDYLLKPIDPDDLTQALAKLTRKSPKPDRSAQLDVLFHNVKAIHNTSKRVALPVATGLIFLQVNDIVRCESDGNYTLIFLKDGQKVLVSRTLKEFDDMLTDVDFFRIHYSHLINLDYVKSYTKGKGGSVLMLDNSRIDVSTRRKDDFLKRVLAGRF